MKTIILAAGRGKRMRPLTETRLKGSLPILNRPLLLRLVDMIDKTDILDELILVVSPGQEEEISSLFSREAYSNKIRITIQDPPRGTGDAVAKGEPFIGADERFFAVNGDILANLEVLLPKLFNHHKKLGALCSMVVIPGASERYGLIKVSEDGRVLNIQEKVKTDQVNGETGYINCGVYLFEREIFDAIKATPLSKREEYEITDSIALLAQGGSIGAVETDSWMSVENPVDLFNAQKFSAPEKELVSMQFHSGEEIGFKAAEDIFFEKGQEVEFSSILFKGPVLVGQGTLIESGSTIGPKVFIGSDCEIGTGTSLENSLIMENCRIGSHCRINSMIAGEEIVIGSKTTIDPKNLSKVVSDEKPGGDVIVAKSMKDFVIIGGKAILSSEVLIDAGVKIASHVIIRRGEKVQEDILLD